MDDNENAKCEYCGALQPAADSTFIGPPAVGTFPNLERDEAGRVVHPDGQAWREADYEPALAFIFARSGFNVGDFLKGELFSGQSAWNAQEICAALFALHFR